jgi:hypothetical protein
VILECTPWTTEGAIIGVENPNLWGDKWGDQATSAVETPESFWT